MNATRLAFPVFLVVALITYFPTIGAGFVYDFAGWQKEYEAGSFADIINCFGYKGNHQVLHLFFYSFYKLFHIAGWPWYLLFTALHAVNAWLLFTWIRRSLVSTRGNVTWIAGLTSLLFLIHPYSIEVVVWKVCLHYLLSMTAILGLLLVQETYMREGRRGLMYSAMAIYGASLFLLELSFVTPVLIALWLGIQALGTSRESVWYLRGFTLTGSLFGLLALYLLLNRFTLGAWIGHYGASAHLSFDFIGIVSTELKYLVKHLFAARYYSFGAKGWLFDQILSNPTVVFTFLAILVSGIVWFVLKRTTYSAGMRFAWFGLLASMLYVLPVSNLYFYHLGVGMNDRYGYVPVAFLCLMLAGLFTRMPRILAYALAIALILVHLPLQQRTIRYWQQSTEVLSGLKADFRWHDRDPVFILSSPDNYKGIVMTSIVNEPSGIHELIDYQTDRPFPGEMYDILQINMNDPMEGVRVEQTGPMQLKVTPTQWGNWWHRNGIGASGYENDLYKVELLDYPYLVTFKQLPPGSAIIYPDSMRWKEFVLQPWPQ